MIEQILMELFTVVLYLYNLRMGIKEDNPSQCKSKHLLTKLF